MSAAETKGISSGSVEAVRGRKFRTYILGVCVALLTISGLVSFASLYVASGFKHSGSKSETMMASMRYQLIADMYHDTLRGVVFHGLFAGASDDKAMAQDALKEVGEYGGLFRDAIASQDKLDLEPAVRQSLDGVKQPLQDYISAAEGLVKKVAQGDLAGAKADLPSFQAVFSKLEGEMTAVEDAIQTADIGEHDAALGNAALSDVVTYGGFGLLTLLAAAMVFFGGKYAAKPLVRLTEGFRSLSEGDLEVAVNRKQPLKELGQLVDVFEVFREALRARARLASEAEAAADITLKHANAAAELNREIAHAVDGALVGDFTLRVTTDLPYPELVALSKSVNNLMETIDRSIGETAEALSALAKADLTHRMTGNYQGALKRLKDDTNAVGENLSGVVAQLRTTSSALKTATGEILSGANDLAERTTKQAAAIEETTAAIEQLSNTVIENAKRADDASIKSRGVSATAEQTGEVMEKSNEAMERISASSSKISNIIGMIDDIAFQTNLLALNASVEAARAGDAGKGFAVVAVEVRRLAQSAAQASSEVKVLIEQSASEVMAGSKLVADATQKLIAMVGSVKESAALIQEISAASQEQASAISQVSTAVRQMDEMTQHNAALVEETNAAIEQTENQANDLDRIVDQFVVKGEGRSAARETSLPTPAKATAKGIKALQEKVTSAARSYLSRGNTAVKEDWKEF